MKICPTCKLEYESGEVFCPVDATRLITHSMMTDAPLSEDPLVGATLNGRYKVLRRIGEGGMGIVYEAEHIVIEKRVALKVLRDDYSRRTEVVERFRQEAKSASRIGHENIVDISDFGETPRGQSYFVMEFLDGEDLANVLARDGVLPARRAIDIAVQCCRALGAAHHKGIVHRDMKPENIFLVHREDGGDFVKIVDFGIAKMSDVETEGQPGRKLTKTGMIFGTPEYMSPEQAAGKPLDHRVDVYAIAVIVYECITGRVPFVGDSFMGILTQHMFEEPPPLRDVNPNVRVSPALEAVIYKGLSKDPDERYARMEDIAEALTATLHQHIGEPTMHGYGQQLQVSGQAPRDHQAQQAQTLEAALPARASTEVYDGRGGGSKLWVVAAILLVLGAVGVGGFVLFGPGTTTASDTPDEPTVQPEPDAGVAVAAVALDAGSAVAAIPAPQQLVMITLDTRPTGASVVVDGRGEVCSSTPCIFETPPGEAIQLTARRGRLTVSRELTPTEATSLTLRLGGTRPPVTTGMTGGDPVGTMMGHDPGMTGLKIPPEFR